MQYVNPPQHKEILLLLAEYGRKQLCDKLEDAIAVCVKADGNVDAHQIDNKFLAIRTVDGDGELSTEFLSAQPPTTRDAEGMLEAVKNGFQETGYDFETKAAKQLTGITSQIVRMLILATKVGFGLGYKKYVKRSCSHTGALHTALI